MSVAVFLRELATEGVSIALKGDRLQLSAAGGILTHELRAEIRTRKAEIVAFLRNADSSGKDDLVLRKAARDEPLPLSFGQQRLWFLHKLDATTPVYNLGASIWVPGAVDDVMLNKSLQELARRHESLRTIFQEADGIPSQVVTSVLPVLGIADMTDLPAERREQQVGRLVDAEIERPFHLAKTPPFRALLIRETPESAKLVLVLHHILADGWSLGLLVKEIGEIYAALASGDELGPIELPWQYTDYAYSEQRWFEESDQQAHVDYWKEKLSGTLSSLVLPFDRPRERVLSSNGASYGFTIPEEVANGLRTLSRESGVTLFTTLLTIFKVLLRRYSGQDDIVVGTAVSNRKRVELETLIGMFVSTLVLRTDLSGDPSVRELLQRVRDTVLDAQEHQDYPFEKVVDLVHMERSLSQSPLFQTAFVLHNTPFRGTYENIGSGSMFELSLYVWDGAGDLSARWEYNPDLFNEETIARMVEHLQTVARAVASQPDRHISQLPLLTERESLLLLDTWNHTDTDFPVDQCIHQLFERQVDATPDATAVVAPLIEGDESAVEVSYRQLDRMANQLAHRLRRLGVTADTRVAVALDRSVDLIVALLAVLKAGGAYVPLDPAYPSDRLAFMIEDADIAALITRQSVRRTVPSVDCPVVDLDLDPGAFATEPDTRPSPIAQPHNLAYVIYTSGSTGKPKGVMVEHRSVVNLLTSMQHEPGLTSTDTLLSVTTLAFDIAGLEIYLPLITGARVVLVSRTVASNGERLAAAITESGATVMQATPATLRLLIESGWREMRSAATRTRLKILCGGEALPRPLADELLAADVELWNMYGPTETTIWSSIRRVHDATDNGSADTTPEPAIIPIGRPIANTKLYVLDEDRHPVPVNVPGELYIGGAGLARGYHNRPELTAERFVENSFVSEPGARMYRTGDQVRYRADGTVEYLGRLDNQVKVRGFRIELGEIESVLATHERVQNAVVLANEYAPGDQRLVAYLVGTDGDAVNSLELRHWLSLVLPQYMVPSAFVFVDAFPLTPNEKIDRRALLTSGAGTQQASQSSIPPQPGLESVVAQVWRETLGVTQVWADDNFFDLGGNSLLGIRLLANLEKVVGQRLPVSVLFEGQTVRNMTAALGHNSGDDPLSLAVRIKSGSEDRPPLFIIPGVNGNVIGYETLAQLLPSEQPVYGLRSVGLNGNAEPLDRLDVIAGRFVDDMRKVQPTGPYHLAGFCIGGSVAYEMAQQLATQNEHVALLAMIGTWPPSSVEDMVSTSPSAQKLAFLGEGIIRHLRAMLAQPRGQRLAYLRQKVRIVLEMIARRDVYRGDTEALHRDWVSGTNRRAAARYSPTPYAGDVLFVIPDSLSPPPDLDPRLTWRDLVRGESTIIRLPGDDSGTLLRPPYMAGLAEVLSESVGDPTISIGSL